MSALDVVFPLSLIMWWWHHFANHDFLEVTRKSTRVCLLIQGCEWFRYIGIPRLCQILCVTCNHIQITYGVPQNNHLILHISRVIIYPIIIHINWYTIYYWYALIMPRRTHQGGVWGYDQKRQFARHIFSYNTTLYHLLHQVYTIILLHSHGYCKINAFYVHSMANCI